MNCCFTLHNSLVVAVMMWNYFRSHFRISGNKENVCTYLQSELGCCEVVLLEYFICPLLLVGMKEITEIYQYFTSFQHNFFIIIYYIRGIPFKMLFRGFHSGILKIYVFSLILHEHESIKIIFCLWIVQLFFSATYYSQFVVPVPDM